MGDFPDVEAGILSRKIETAVSDANSTMAGS